jgi:poly(hydroxyalkanoate) depolymerase family esterase
VPSTPGRWLHHKHTGPHGSRIYDVYRPAGLDPRTPVALVLLLHGCRQGSVEFAEESGFTRAADAEGFVVAAPRQEVRHQFGRCWRWYDSGHQQRNLGEPALLAGIVAEILGPDTGFPIDRRRVYAAGLSAGGAMSLILATTYPDLFAAGAVHSATAYRSATQSFRALAAMAARGKAPRGATGEMAPVVLIHGTGDQVVRPTNADRIVDQWLTSRDEGGGWRRVRTLARTRSFVVDGRRCIRTRRYSLRGRRVLEYWRVDGLGHAWSGGRTPGSYIDPNGPEATQIMTSFFRQHRLPYPTNGPDGRAFEDDFG